MMLITGGSGYLGARLMKDFSELGHDVMGTYRSGNGGENFLHMDLGDTESIVHAFEQAQPDILIHTAGSVNQRQVAQDLDLARRINLDATQTLVDLCKEHDTKMVYVSSTAANYPESLYGIMKREAEGIVESAGIDHLIIRPSMIFGSSPNTESDRPHNRLLRNIEGTPAKYTTGMKFRPTYAGHITQVLDACFERNLWNCTLPIATNEVKSYFEVARDLLDPVPVEAHHQEPRVFTESVEILFRFDLPLLSYAHFLKSVRSELDEQA